MEEIAVTTDNRVFENGGRLNAAGVSPRVVSAVYPAAQVKSRIAAIDVMRGLVMLIMLIDHVRETIYLHMQVGDPMNVATIEPALFFTRLAAHICAPVFVFLTGLSAWLYAHPSAGYRSPSGYLIKRGLLLVVFELTLVGFPWAVQFTPIHFWLQVIWAIGISMIVLGLLVEQPRWLLAALGSVIVFGHNLLTPLTFEPGSFMQGVWMVLHERGVLYASDTFIIKVTYPVLPWIGVILLGYVAGPLYSRAVDGLQRRKALIGLGLACLLLLAFLRGFNIYGETLPWVAGVDTLRTLMSWLNFTKYPPSLDFLLLTLGTAFLLMSWFESLDNKATRVISIYGSAPMFFYLLHLYVLLLLSRTFLVLFGANHGARFGVDEVWWIWVMAPTLAFALYLPCRAFARFKHTSKQAWVRYF